MSTALIIVTVIVGLAVTLLTVLLLRSALAPRRVGALARLLNQGRTRQVLVAAKRLLVRDPRSTDARYLLGLAYLKEERPELALTEFRAINESGRFTDFCREHDFRRRAADLYDRFGQVEEALKEYLLLLQTNTADPQLLFSVGALFERRGDMDKAAAYYTKTVQVQPDRAEAHAHLGLLQYRAKHPVEAKRALEAATRLDPGNATASFYLGKMMREGGDPHGALGLLEQASRDADLRAKALLEAGTCYMSLGDHDRAVSSLQRSIRAAGNEENTALYARYFLGLAYEKMREFDKAIEQWELVRAAKASFRDVEEKLAQYRQMSQDDGMKDYLSTGSAEFGSMCRKLTGVLGLEVTSSREIPDGFELQGLVPPSGMIQRRMSYLLHFLRPSVPIDDATVRGFLERMKSLRADRGVMACSAGFSRRAQTLAQTRPLDLFDGVKLGTLLKGRGK